MTKADCEANLYSFGNARFLRLAIKPSANISAYTTVANIATGHRPNSTAGGIAATVATSPEVRNLQITTAGAIRLRGGTSGATYYAYVVYFV